MHVFFSKVVSHDIGQVTHPLTRTSFNVDFSLDDDNLLYLPPVPNSTAYIHFMICNINVLL